MRMTLFHEMFLFSTIRAKSIMLAHFDGFLYHFSSSPSQCWSGSMPYWHECHHLMQHWDSGWGKGILFYWKGWEEDCMGNSILKDIFFIAHNSWIELKWYMTHQHVLTLIVAGSPRALKYILLGFPSLLILPVHILERKKNLNVTLRWGP